MEITLQRYKIGSMVTTQHAIVPIQLRNGNHLDSSTDQADGGNVQISDEQQGEREKSRQFSKF